MEQPPRSEPGRTGAASPARSRERLCGELHDARDGPPSGGIGFSAAPLVLGLILGQLTETNFLQGRLIAGDEVWSYFLAGPINKIVIGLCVLSIGYSIYNERREIARRRREAMA